MEQVTKIKNAGRQASGKKLVEWNKKNKEDMLKKIQDADQVLVKVPVKVLNQKPISTDQVVDVSTAT